MILQLWLPADTSCLRHCSMSLLKSCRMWHTTQVLKRSNILMHSSLQRRLTFQWDLWTGRPLLSLPAVEQATCRFLLTAAASLTSSSTYSLRSHPFLYQYAWRLGGSQMGWSDGEAM